VIIFGHYVLLFVITFTIINNIKKYTKKKGVKIFADTKWGSKLLFSSNVRAPHPATITIVV
jgi:hypothetical protein